MRPYLTTAVAVVVLGACARGERDTASDTTSLDSPAAAATPDTRTATAVVRDASGRDLGTLTLTESTGGIAISGSLVGLAPGEHGIHLHMMGRCDAPSFESAGEHWNPTNRQHGTQNPEGPHLGDLPNVTAGPDSTAAVNVSATTGGSLRGTNMLLDSDGAAVVIHAAPDDYRSDPAGGSGSRVACGVVSSP